MLEEATIRVSKNGDYVVPKKVMEELIGILDRVERRPLRSKAKTKANKRTVRTESHPIYGRKHTYCCFMGPQDNECQQFRSYSFQAPLFCIRMARNRGYSQGRVRRGDCPENC